jgi:TolB-like protein/Flp pilus assembly protein TadD
MQNVLGVTNFNAPFAEWTTERLDSWKEIASFFRREVRTVQLWERSEGLPVRRQYHKKLGSVYAYRRELEGWWIARSALSSGYAQRPEEGPKRPLPAVTTVAAPTDTARPADAAESAEVAYGRILLFPLEVVHSRRDRGPLQQIVDRFAGGLKDDLNLELGRLRFNPICLSNGTLPAQGASTPAFMRNVAREFGAELYLTGAVRYAGNEVRVSMQLVCSDASICVWADRFETTLDHVFQAQAELARKIAQALPEPMMRSAARARQDRAVEQGPAYHAYMMGLHFWKQRTATDLMRAVSYFQDAISLDPSCADAYAGLADTYVSLSYNHVMPPRQATEAAQQAVDTALKLAPTARNVRHAEINFKTNCTWEWQAAERVCRELVDSGGNDVRTLYLYASLMINFGRHDEAISLALHAHRMDPLSDNLNSLVSFAYFYAGDYDSALSFIQRAIELKPKFTMGHALLGRTQAERGNWGLAIEAFQRGLELGNDSTFLKALLAYGHAGGGNAHTANEILREIEQERGDGCFPAYDVSAVHAILNQEGEALRNICKAYDMRDIKMTWIQHDPRFTRLRSLAQFQQIASSVCSRVG